VLSLSYSCCPVTTNAIRETVDTALCLFLSILHCFANSEIQSWSLPDGPRHGELDRMLGYWLLISTIKPPRDLKLVLLLVWTYSIDA